MDARRDGNVRVDKGRLVPHLDRQADHVKLRKRQLVPVAHEGADVALVDGDDARAAARDPAPLLELVALALEEGEDGDRRAVAPRAPHHVERVRQRLARRDREDEAAARRHLQLARQVGHRRLQHREFLLAVWVGDAARVELGEVRRRRQRRLLRRRLVANIAVQHVARPLLAVAARDRSDVDLARRAAARLVVVRVVLEGEARVLQAEAAARVEGRAARRRERAAAALHVAAGARRLGEVVLPARRHGVRRRRRRRRRGCGTQRRRRRNFHGCWCCIGERVADSRRPRGAVRSRGGRIVDSASARCGYGAGAENIRLKHIPAAKAARYLSAVVRRVMPTSAAQTATGARLATPRERATNAICAARPSSITASRAQ